MAGSSGVTEKRTTFMDIPRCAAESGYSLRHFRRLIDDQKIPIVQIRHKFMLLRKDFEAFMASERKRKSGLETHRRNRGA